MIVILGADSWDEFQNKLFTQLENLGSLIVATAQENQAKIDALGVVANKIKDEVAALKAAYEEGQDLDFAPLTAVLGDIDAINEDAVVEPEPEPEPGV